MARIDLNCDMGEAFGAYSFGNDSKILDYITSANVACGFHAGDPITMASTIRESMAKQVAIGAHPGFRDLVGFGRRKIEMSEKELYHDVLYQVAAMDGMAKAQGAQLKHVKPHGALYNMAAKDKGIAHAIARAIVDVNPLLVLVGLSGSQLIEAGKEIGIATASEVFADRTYQPDGSLTPRSQSNALIHDPSEAAERVIRMVKEGTIEAVDGSLIDIQADTVCVHGDNPKAFEFLDLLTHALDNEGILIKPIGDE